MDEVIYLDYNATTPVHPQVIEDMLPVLQEHFGNPSSSHSYGRAAKQIVETARQQVAALLNCQAQEIVFSSGGTESNNHALRGAVLNGRHQPNGERNQAQVITSAVEHPAVLQVCRWLEAQGWGLTVLPVASDGLVDPADLAAAISKETILVSIMHANNEVGTIQPVKALAEIAHRHGALFHSDAAQTVGKIEVDVEALGVDLLSIAGHKLYAPKGVGALYIRQGTTLANLMFGAGHENGRRPGTENVLEICGLGAACQLAAQDLPQLGPRLQALRDRLHHGLASALGKENLRLNGHPEKRLPNTLSLGFKGIAADALLAEISDTVAASAGSACHAGSVAVSPVLAAMGVPLEYAMGTVRFSVGRGTTEDQVDRAVEAVRRGMEGLKD